MEHTIEIAMKPVEKVAMWKTAELSMRLYDQELTENIEHDMENLLVSAISTDGMDKWLDDAYPDLDRRKANMIYEIASLIKDDPDTAPVLIEELV